MKNVNGHHDHIMFWGNLITALAYFVITAQLLFFAFDPKVVKIFYSAEDAKDSRKRRIFMLLLSVAVLFASFISLCGTGHLMNVLEVLHPANEVVRRGQLVVMWLMTIVSFLTALAGFPLFPAIANAIKGVELSSDGKLQLAESYLVEVVDMIKESILVLSDDLVVLKCNDVSKQLFGPDIVGSSICKLLHPADLPLFRDALAQVAESYTMGATTIEVRVQYVPETSVSQRRSTQPRYKNHKSGKFGKVYATEEPPFNHNGDIEMGETELLTATREAQSLRDEYVWIEVTACKGKPVLMKGMFQNDIKLVCRNIDDRKKRQAFQELVEGTEELGRINEAKLRYVSCIAHDLKTPLQSFSFSLDLLMHSQLSQEQSEFVQQANVAVDLMRLTISQTMDISKALTGAKLMPRRTSVFLSSVLNRVKIIINGYGKQVPVSFEVAPDVCDEIITDEEWLWQMLLNLLTNACKYTDRGSIHVRISVVRNQNFCALSLAEKLGSFKSLNGSSKPPRMLLCEVIDTGVGISPDKIHQVFDAFAQVQEGQVTGTGLGLFGVRTRAEGLQGTCGARHNTESSTGTGTVLWFALPYVPNGSLSASSRSPMQSQLNLAGSLPEVDSSTWSIGRCVEAAFPEYSALSHAHSCSQLTMDTTFDSPNTPVAKSNRSSPPMVSPSSDLPPVELAIRALKLTAMVVDDTPTVRKLMQKLLLSMGFESVVCYENGSKGLEAMMAGPVDIVFSDVQMPIMTGPEMTRRFRLWESSGLLHQQSAVTVSQWAAKSQSSSGFTESSRGNPSCPSFMTRKRQLIVAVTANSSECEKVNNGGFDEICAKPLTRADIHKIIIHHFQC